MFWIPNQDALRKIVPMFPGSEIVSKNMKGCLVWKKLFCVSGREQTPVMPEGCSVVAIVFMVLLLTFIVDIPPLSSSVNMDWDEGESLKKSVTKTVFKTVFTSRAEEIILVPSIKNSLFSSLYFLYFRDLRYFILDLEIILSLMFLY